MRFRPLRGATAWGVVILVLCLTPGSALPTWHWADLISMDKLIHAAIFGLFMWLLFKGFKGQAPSHGLYRNALPMALSVAMAYGLLMEGLQEIPALGRRGDVLDIIANSSGILAVWGWHRWRHAEKRPSPDAMDV